MSIRLGPTLVLLFATSAAAQLSKPWDLSPKLHWWRGKKHFIGVQIHSVRIRLLGLVCRRYSPSL